MKLFKKLGAFLASAKKIWKETKPARDDLFAKIRAKITTKGGAATSSVWKIAKTVIITGTVILIVCTVPVLLGWSLFKAPPGKTTYVIAGVVWIIVASAFAAVSAFIIGSTKGWKKGLLSFIALEAGIILLPILIYKIVNTGGTVLRIGGIALGIIAIGGLIYLAVTRAGAVQTVTGNILSKDNLQKIAIATGIALIIASLINWTAVSGQRDVWSEIPKTLPWLIGGTILGAILITFLKGWGRASGVVLIIIVYSMAMREVGNKVVAEQRAINQVRTEELRRRAAATPSSRKVWRVGIQNYTREGMSLPGFKHYDAEVSRIDRDALEMSITFVENGKPLSTTFVWDRQRDQYGTWKQNEPAGSGKFRFWPVEGIDRYEGEWFIGEKGGKRFALTLEGNTPPEF